MADKNVQKKVFAAILCASMSARMKLPWLVEVAGGRTQLYTS